MVLSEAKAGSRVDHGWWNNGMYRVGLWDAYVADTMGATGSVKLSAKGYGVGLRQLVQSQGRTRDRKSERVCQII